VKKTTVELPAIELIMRSAGVVAQTLLATILSENYRHLILCTLQVFLQITKNSGSLRAVAIGGHESKPAMFVTANNNSDHMPWSLLLVARSEHI